MVCLGAAPLRNPLFRIIATSLWSEHMMPIRRFGRRRPLLRHAFASYTLLPRMVWRLMGLLCGKCCGTLFTKHRLASSIIYLV